MVPLACLKCVCVLSSLLLTGDTVLSVLQQLSNSIKDSLEKEVIHYNYKTSFFDIFVSGSIRDPLLQCDLCSAFYSV